MADELVGLVGECRELVEDLGFPRVRSWLGEHSGGGVLGHFQVYFPEELAHAAGLFPLKVVGGSSGSQIRQADPRIAAFVCSIVRSSLELGLSGRLDFLSMFVIPSICDAIRNACGVWVRNFPRMNVQILYFPQHADSSAAADYLTGEYRRIAGAIEEGTGRPISD